MPKIEMYAGPNCNYCAAAKDLLRKAGLDWQERDVADPAIAAEFRTRLPRVRSIPQIFVDDQHIGGYEDLSLLLERRDPRLVSE